MAQNNQNPLFHPSGSLVCVGSILRQAFASWNQGDCPVLHQYLHVQVQWKKRGSLPPGFGPACYCPKIYPLPCTVAEDSVYFLLRSGGTFTDWLIVVCGDWGRGGDGSGWLPREFRELSLKRMDA
jgi:hypothetical protein